MIAHHPGDDLLLSYAAGSLGESWSVAIAAHLALCPVCRDAVAATEHIGGVLLDETPAETMSAGSLEDLLTRLDEAPVEASEPAAPERAVLPEPLRSYIGGDVDDVPWKSSGGGTYQHLLSTNDSAQARLLLIPEGRPVPEHGHRGRELTLVLSGSFHDQTGTFGRGDMEDADEDLIHMPIAGRSEDCVCLAVTDAPLKFTRFGPRLAQLFNKI